MGISLQMVNHGGNWLYLSDGKCYFESTKLNIFAVFISLPRIIAVPEFCFPA